MASQFNRCPVCAALTEVPAPLCGNCGHVFSGKQALPRRVGLFERVFQQMPHLPEPAYRTAGVKRGDRRMVLAVIAFVCIVAPCIFGPVILILTAMQSGEQKVMELLRPANAPVERRYR
jgi:hypothetical protein